MARVRTEFSNIFGCSLLGPRWKTGNKRVYTLMSCPLTIKRDIQSFVMCKFSYYKFSLLYRGFLSSSAFYRMIRRGGLVTPSPTNNTQTFLTVGCLLYVMYCSLHIDIKKYKSTQNKRDTQEENNAPSFVTYCTTYIHVTCEKRVNLSQ
jgi:hypothetical protein